MLPSNTNLIGKSVEGMYRNEFYTGKIVSCSQTRDGDLLDVLVLADGPGNDVGNFLSLSPYDRWSWEDVRLVTPPEPKPERLIHIKIEITDADGVIHSGTRVTTQKSITRHRSFPFPDAATLAQQLAKEAQPLLSGVARKVFPLPE